MGENSPNLVTLMDTLLLKQATAFSMCSISSKQGYWPLPDSFSKIGRFLSYCAGVFFE
jgi:hypothetical protein